MRKRLLLVAEKRPKRKRRSQSMQYAVGMNRSVRSPTRSASRSGSNSSSRSISVAANTGQKRTKEKKKSSAAQEY